MGAGGVIQQHAADLLTVIVKPSIYNCLSSMDKDLVEIVKLKPELNRTQEDVNFLLDKLNQVCRE